MVRMVFTNGEDVNLYILELENLIESLIETLGEITGMRNENWASS